MKKEGERNEYSCRYLEGEGKVGVSLMVDATNQCQLRCRYCYYGEKGQQMMDVPRVFAAARNMAALFGQRLKEVNIHYMGGEPLVAWDRMLDLNELAKRHFAELGIPFSWSLTSNLVGLTEARAEHMVREKASIHCSIDGPADIQNRNRPFRSGKGSYAKVVKAIPLALRVTPNDTARVTVCPDDARRMPEIAEEILDHGFKVVGLFPARMDGWEGQALEDWQEGISGALDLVTKKYRGRKKVSTLIREEVRGRVRQRFNYCGAGKGLWAIGVDGQLYFCHHMTNRYETAIIDASIASVEAIRRAIESSPLPPRNGLPQEVCGNCPALPFCNGGCWSDNYLFHGSSVYPDPTDCRVRVATVQAIGERMLVDPPKKGDGRKQACTFCLINCDGCDGCMGKRQPSCCGERYECGCGGGLHASRSGFREQQLFLDPPQEREAMQACSRCVECQNCYACDNCDASCQSGCEQECQVCDSGCQATCEKNCQDCEGRCETSCEKRCERCDACEGCYSSCDECQTRQERFGECTVDDYCNWREGSGGTGCGGGLGIR